MQGPLSSIRAVIKRTSRSTTQVEQQRERRRPEITIVAAEPIGPGSWFNGGPSAGLGFPPPPQWTPSESHPEQPPSYEQVIKEINQVQVTTTNGNVEPRRTTTCATQTDFQEEEDRNVPGSNVIDQPVVCEQEPASVQKPTEISHLPSLVTKDAQDSDPQVASCNTTETEVRQEDPNVIRHPVPRPRTKANIKPVGNDNPSIVQDNREEIFHSRTKGELTFIQPCLGFHDNFVLFETNNMSHDRSQNSIVSRIKAFESQAESSDQSRRPEIAPRSFNIKSSVTVKPTPAPKPLCNRTSGEWDPTKDNKPKVTPREGLLPPRLQDTGGTTKPDLPKKPKPSLVKSSSGNGFPDVILRASVSGNSNKDADRKVPVPAPRPLLPKKLLQTDNSASLSAVPRPVAAAAPKLSVAIQAKAFTTTEIPAVRGPAPVVQSKPAGEFDLISFDDDILPPVVLPCPEVTYDSEAIADPFQLFPKDDKEQPAPLPLLRKPTVIRISSKLARSSEELQLPPPLPAAKPVGSLYSKSGVKARLAGKKEWEQSECAEGSGSKPVLPTRPIDNKGTETHHPPQKGPPGRPPPPKVSKTSSQRDAVPRSFSEVGLSVKHNTSGMKRSKSQVLRRPQPELPPRPRPGHPLYNKYTLPLPHGIAEKDIVSKNPGELSCKRGEVLVLLEQTDDNYIHCQKGGASGEVGVSNLKIITPLNESSENRQKDLNHVNTVEDSHTTPRAVVLHDFAGAHAEDLCLSSGETVYLLEKIDSEWYRGKCRSNTGIFPANHVRVMVDVPDKVQQRQTSLTSCTKGPRCMARFEFIADQKNELSFSEGDVILLKEYINDEWARGESKGHTGIFPINFVEIVEDLPAFGPNKIVSDVGDSHKIRLSAPAAQQMKMSGEWCDALYDYTAETEEDLPFKRGDKILITEQLDAEWYKGRLNGREGILPAAFVQLCSGSKPRQTQGGMPGKARALYDFCGENEDELSLKAGDMISALESIDDEWMCGELHGRSGIFPKNFVQICYVDEA
ncbi:SH3 domain-containing protein 19 isoform X3 [Ascaphus truei]|uniref:SH3 domain-containing protein 19 isoform X3 n=1 Tax=Ascaphus truei TaxID=8439 RepID=UPI003F5915B6